MIGQRLAWNLSASDTAAVSKHREKQRIHAATFLHHVENSLSAFIHKRDGTDLNADHLGRDGSSAGGWHGQGGASPGADFQEFAAVYVQSQAITPLRGSGRFCV
jgi:hypothetical protein